MLGTETLYRLYEEQMALNRLLPRFEEMYVLFFVFVFLVEEIHTYL